MRKTRKNKSTHRPSLLTLIQFTWSMNVPMIQRWSHSSTVVRTANRRNQWTWVKWTQKRKKERTSYSEPCEWIDEEEEERKKKRPIITTDTSDVLHGYSEKEEVQFVSMGRTASCDSLCIFRSLFLISYVSWQSDHTVRLISSLLSPFALLFSLRSFIPRVLRLASSSSSSFSSHVPLSFAGWKYAPLRSLSFHRNC